MNAQRAEWRKTLDAAIEAWRPQLQVAQASVPPDDKSVTPSLMASRGIPTRLHEQLHQGAYRMTEAIETLRMCIDRGPKIIVLSGKPGTGKTFAGSWLAAQSPRAKLIRAAALQRGGLYDTTTLDAATEVPRLVLDDLGVEYNDERGMFRALLEELINARYDRGALTVITTNLSSEEFSDRYGERIIDRIREVGQFISIGGESMRRKT